MGAWEGVACVAAEGVLSVRRLTASSMISFRQNNDSSVKYLINSVPDFGAILISSIVVCKLRE